MSASIEAAIAMSTEFSRTFITKRFVDYDRGEIKRAKQQKSSNHSAMHPSPHLSTRIQSFAKTLRKRTTERLVSAPNPHTTLQSKRCDDICTTKQTKLQSNTPLQYHKQTTNKARMMATVTTDTTCVQRQVMNGNGKMSMESHIKSGFGSDMNEYKVSVQKLNIKRDKRKNNVIIGVQITDTKGINTVYSNERGQIFLNTNYVKKGFKIKNKSQMILTIQYYHEEESICIDFGYIKHGKVVEIEKEPIVIENVNSFEHGVTVKVFVAQNENAKHGEYVIWKLPTPKKW
eukprot:211550_1